jgi:hypothetical protein
VPTSLQEKSKREGGRKENFEKILFTVLCYSSISFFFFFWFVYLSILLPIVRLRGSVVFGCKLTPLDGSANTHRPII